MKIRIYYKDTDAGGIVYHSNYINFCEQARSEYFFANKVKTFDSNRYFVVSQIEAKYHKPTFLGDIIEVKTSIANIKRVSITLKQEIFRIENIDAEKINQLSFSANITIAFLKNGKPSKIDEDILSVFKRL